jgi:diguanylate cyclase
MPRNLFTSLAVLRALRRREIVLHYQPKVSLATGELVGAEALARWQHPRHGLIPPADWLVATEVPWLERRFARYTIERAIEQCARWKAEDRDLIVGVNITPRALADRSLPAFVTDLLRRTGAEARHVAIELTEAALDVSPHARTVARELSDLGLILKLDDFGIGHSSMERVVALPLHEIKIDRRFVTKLSDTARERAVVRAAVGLGRDLGLRVIAEGIETPFVLRSCAELGCDTAQGFLISQPMPAAELPNWQPSDDLRIALVPQGGEPFKDRRRIARRAEDPGTQDAVPARPG